MGLSKREIEYLEVIDHLERNGSKVTLTAIAERLRISVPSVFEEVLHLREKGYVKKVGRSVELTEEGKKALDYYRKAHRVIETLLVRSGVDKAKACELSAKFDVTVPAEVIDALYEYLGKPKECPHGNPIP
ncbi:MAG: metal-dependent transcriptional regulator [Sulfolobaceae archaeon]|nr:metal-dependent transcriptional regulator [Sulfolobales archaeon]